MGPTGAGFRPSISLVSVIGWFSFARFRARMLSGWATRALVAPGSSSSNADRQFHSDGRRS